MKIKHIGNKIYFNEAFSKIKRSSFVNKNVSAKRFRRASRNVYFIKSTLSGEARHSHNSYIRLIFANFLRLSFGGNC